MLRSLTTKLITAMGIDVSGWVDVNRSRWKLVVFFFEIDPETGKNKSRVYRSILAEDKKNQELSQKKLLNKYVFHNKNLSFRSEIKTAVMFNNITGEKMNTYHLNKLREVEK